jgi:hypothetical protein
MEPEILFTRKLMPRQNLARGASAELSRAHLSA